MSEKILGGALLINSVHIDFKSGLINMDEAIRQVRIIKDYESGKITLQDLNKTWQRL